MTGQTGADRLADVLRQQVLAGDLAPDAPVREEAVAEEHGLSRHTVRRALERLVAERLLVAEPYRGVRVASFSDDDVVALQQLRAALECEAVRLLVQEHGDRWPETLLGPLRLAVDAIGEDGVIEEAHSAFHRLLVSSAGSPRITEAYARLDTEVLLFLRQLRPHYDRSALVSEHSDYLADLQRRGEQAVRAHLEHSTRLLLALRARA